MYINILNKIIFIFIFITDLTVVRIKSDIYIFITYKNIIVGCVCMIKHIYLKIIFISIYHIYLQEYNSKKNNQ